MNKRSIFYLFLLFLLFPLVNAHAYLDPGSGSMILQSLLAGLMIIGSGIGIFRNKVKSFFRRLFKKDEKQ